MESVTIVESVTMLYMVMKHGISNYAILGHEAWNQ